MRQYLNPHILWQGDHVSKSMKIVEEAASDGYFKNVYSFRVAQLLLDALSNIIDIYIIYERSGSYLDFWLKLNNDIKTLRIDGGGFRYFIITEFADQLKNRIFVIKQRLSHVKS